MPSSILLSLFDIKDVVIGGIDGLLVHYPVICPLLRRGRTLIMGRIYGNFGLARPDGLFTCHLFHIALGIGIGTGAEWFFMVRTPAWCIW